MLFGSATFWQVETPLLYELYGVESGQRPFTPGFFNRITGFTRTLVPFQILFVSCLWTIKISLLLFFRRLGSTVRGHRAWWWFVLVVNILAWCGTIGGIYYKCALGPTGFVLCEPMPPSAFNTDFVLAYCATPPANKKGNDFFIGSCAADLVTNCLRKANLPGPNGKRANQHPVISIPVWMLWNVKISLRQKILLMGIFSLSAVVMIVAVIRVALVNTTRHARDISWLFFWNNMEMTTCKWSCFLVDCLDQSEDCLLSQQSSSPVLPHSGSSSSPPIGTGVV